MTAAITGPKVAQCSYFGRFGRRLLTGSRSCRAHGCERTGPQRSGAAARGPVHDRIARTFGLGPILQRPRRSQRQPFATGRSQRRRAFGARRLLGGARRDRQESAAKRGIRTIRRAAGEQPNARGCTGSPGQGRRTCPFSVGGSSGRSNALDARPFRCAGSATRRGGVWCPKHGAGYETVGSDRPTAAYSRLTAVICKIRRRPSGSRSCPCRPRMPAWWDRWW
jgi:hypothetical protein